MQTGEDRRALALAGADVAVRADGPEGAERFHGHAAVFDVQTDIGDPFTWGFVEEIAPGCFTDTVRDDDQRFLLDHASYYVVARRSANTLNLAQDGRGLAVDAALDPDLTYVGDLKANVRNRNITGMSFGFFTVADEWRAERMTRAGRSGTVQVRRLTAARVPEVSAVTFPAYETSDAGMRAEDPTRAVGLALRSHPDAARQFEARSRLRPGLDRYFVRETVTVRGPQHQPAAVGEVRHQGVLDAARHDDELVERRDQHRRVAADAGRRSWYRIEQRAEGEGERVAEVLLYDVIGGGWFFGGVDAEQLVRELAEVDVDRIVVRINSPGGDVYDGLAIMNALHAHPAPVTSVIEGLAASAASYIAMAGERVEMWANAEMMIHEARGIAIGDSAEMHAFGDRLDRIGDNIASIYARRAGGSTEQWRERMRDETWYFASEALDAGLIDVVLEPPAREDDDPDPDDDERDDDERAARNGFRFARRAAAPAPTTGGVDAHRPTGSDRAAVLHKITPAAAGRS